MEGRPALGRVRHAADRGLQRGHHARPRDHLHAPLQHKRPAAGEEFGRWGGSRRTGYACETGDVGLTSQRTFLQQCGALVSHSLLRDLERAVT